MGVGLRDGIKNPSGSQNEIDAFSELTPPSEKTDHKGGSYRGPANAGEAGKGSPLRSTDHAAGYGK